MWHTAAADAVVLAAEHRARFRMGLLLLLLWWKRPVRMTVGPAVLAGRRLLLVGWAGWALLLVRGRSHRWAHVVGWAHRGMHAGPVAVALGRRWTGRAAVAALVLQVLLKVVQGPW